MPELPEVETIRRDLEKAILGKKITEVCVHAPRVIREPSIKLFKKGIEGATVKKILRRAKILILELSNGKSLAVHLRMTGQLVYPGAGKASRVAFKLSNGKQLDFNDQRLFAELRLLKDWRQLPFIQGLGPEPFDLSFEEFARKLSQKKTKLKPLLMDQTFISGIGNLYASEVLFRAKIRPDRPANSLTGREQKALFDSVRQVLAQAIKSGGSSVDDYVRLSGDKGSYVKYHQVYGRKGKPCFKCGQIIIRTALGGRGTFFCPHCQR